MALVICESNLALSPQCHFSLIACARFIVVSVLSTHFQTPDLKHSTNPVYAAKDATFDFPIYFSLADKLGVVELVIWDKDMLMKEYFCEVTLLLDDWFRQEGIYVFDDPNNQVRQYSQLCNHCPKPTTFVF
jgi:hypothetical protein